MGTSALGPRVLLRRLREVMAEPVTAQKRLANASFARREADEIPGYSYPIPRKR